VGIKFCEGKIPSGLDLEMTILRESDLSKSKNCVMINVSSITLWQVIQAKFEVTYCNCICVIQLLCILKYYVCFNSNYLIW